MAPFGTKIKPKVQKSRKPRRSYYKKKQVKLKNMKELFIIVEDQCVDTSNDHDSNMCSSISTTCSLDMKIDHSGLFLPRANNGMTEAPSECSMTSNTIGGWDFESDKHTVDVSSSDSVCSTPKGQRYKIPEIATCPPAPKKQRMLSFSNCSNSSLQRRPSAFFAPPDLELFFSFAFRKISV